MTATGFEPIAASLHAALTDWFADRDRAAAEATIATNSSLVEERVQPLIAMLERRGVASLHGRRVVDLGCGFGAVAVYLAWRGAEVHGIDANPTVLQVGNAVAAEHGLLVRLDQGRMEALPAGDGEYDVALMNNTLCYLVGAEERHAALSEAARVLTPGGVLVLRDLNAVHPVDHFTGLPLLPALPPRTASRVAAWRGRSRPAVRAVSPRLMRSTILSAGFTSVEHEASRTGVAAKVLRPVARYQHFTARPVQ